MSRSPPRHQCRNIGAPAHRRVRAGLAEVRLGLRTSQDFRSGTPTPAVRTSQDTLDGRSIGVICTPCGSDQCGTRAEWGFDCSLAPNEVPSAIDRVAEAGEVALSAPERQPKRLKVRNLMPVCTLGSDTLVCRAYRSRGERLLLGPAQAHFGAVLLCSNIRPACGSCGGEPSRCATWKYRYRESRMQRYGCRCGGPPVS